MDKQTKKILLFAALGLVAYYLLTTARNNNAYYDNPYSSLVDSINGAIQGLGGAVNGIITTTKEQKRADKQQSYDNLRDTKDNSALFSNDILIVDTL